MDHLVIAIYILLATLIAVPTWLYHGAQRRVEGLAAQLDAALHALDAAVADRERLRVELARATQDTQQIRHALPVRRPRPAPGTGVCQYPARPRRTDDMTAVMDAVQREQR